MAGAVTVVEGVVIEGVGIGKLTLSRVVVAIAGDTNLEAFSVVLKGQFKTETCINDMKLTQMFQHDS